MIAVAAEAAIAAFVVAAVAAAVVVAADYPIVVIDFGFVGSVGYIDSISADDPIDEMIAEIDCFVVESDFVVVADLIAAVAN
jgi:hypothetical protein